MHSFALSSLVVSVLAGSAFAADWQKAAGTVKHKELLSRQTQYGSGATCADAFGDGYVQCGTGIYCYNPDEGQICCNGGSDNYITLPPGFQTSAAVATTVAAATSTGTYTSYTYSASTTVGPTTSFGSTTFSASTGTVASSSPISTSTTSTSASTAAASTATTAAVTDNAAVPQQVLGGAAIGFAGLIGVVGNLL
ncbi:MAG: hypothetical protein M4579_002217 [Chaenotheca gracillima]|nr:MAG: hypothetical protein M4579_002217 [Chaenotheca gracillima]